MNAPCAVGVGVFDNVGQRLGGGEANRLGLLAVRARLSGELGECVSRRGDRLWESGIGLLQVLWIGASYSWEDTLSAGSLNVASKLSPERARSKPTCRSTVFGASADVVS